MPFFLMKAKDFSLVFFSVVFLFFSFSLSVWSLYTINYAINLMLLYIANHLYFYASIYSHE